MLPTLAEGDRLLVRYGTRPRIGTVVVARFVDGSVVVKRVAEARQTRIGGVGWWLLSDNQDEGVDSRHRGPIPDADVWGVARYRVWPRPGRLRRRAR